mmetsp:Transcript_6658/g.9724  ORF Transcript_6658/g.9724 Transcript_6658/m.9724 type:complete len:100 (+) Transcript_6658:74-373(+)|eukprot:CAMPEP_0196810264 /NCGR_PEP_ID=MMETSP1362-20130617/10080_1 /TAXON_ID=163516 /ORGANISM="Leptocylindrus danicus, Strain CCMP1856" /LENGTH=99 /DNA_ID=CAMNT_0042185177 /DNA_START=66 /DNA_END=365 /DNA_ORIENTATION=-
MKLNLLLVAALAQVANAFTFVRHSTSATRLYAEGIINESVDKDSPKVATMESLEAGAKKVYCRCWQSGTFPLCDGAHMKHNEKTGDNVGPLIVSVPKSE